MIDKAIEKITKEAMEIDDPLSFTIEEILTARCTTSTVAMKILRGDKKLIEIHDSLIEKARKSAKQLKGGGKGAYIDIEPEILKYYEIYGFAKAPQKESAEKVDILNLI